MRLKGIIVFVLIIMLFVNCLTVEAFALKLDGIIDKNEWKSADKIEIVSSSDAANCDVSYGMMYIIRDESASMIYIGFKVTVIGEIDDDSVYGVAVSTDSDEFIYVTTDGVSDYDIDKYNVEADICAYSDSAFSVEIALGVKYGLSTVDSLCVRLLDVTGNPSNVYTVDMPYGEMFGSEFVTQPIHNNQDSAVGTSERTTKVKTTKIKTTKVKTTKVKTTKVKTTKVKITKPKKTKTDIALENTDSTVTEQIKGQTTVDPYGEETTVLSVREFKLQKGFTYTSVCVLLLLAIGICVAVNYARDKEKSRESEKKDKNKKD